MQPAVEQGNTSQSSNTPTLYRHTKKKEWGLALLAWEQDGKRGYRFEDGEVRVFKEGYYDLLEEVDAPADQSSPLLAELDRQQRRADKAAGNEPAITFEEQLGVFLEQFPEGFGSKEWLEKHRGQGGRRLKRHRDSAIAQAQKDLSAEAIDAALASGDLASVQKAALDVVENTDLVTKSQLDPLKRATPTEDFIRTLRNLLYGENEIGVRFDAFCRELATNSGRPPSWPLVTAVPSLVQPKDFICIRPSVFKTQADASSVTVRGTKTPSSRSYGGFLEMAADLRDQLTAAGHPPRDYLDLYDFIWVTLRPSSQEILEKVRVTLQKQRLAEARAAGGSEEGDEAEEEATEAPAQHA